MSSIDTPILDCSNLHVAYHRKEILRGATLVVHRGEFVGLFGNNGAGKSTLLRAVAGVLGLRDGSIQYHRHGGCHALELAGMPTWEINRLGIGYLLQGGQIFHNLTVMENLYVAFGERDGGSFEERREEVLAHFPRLTDLLHKRSGLLSGGERQMLAIALVMSQRPELLLLDEPTAGLAEHLASGLLTMLANMCQSTGSSILMVEQNVDLARSVIGRAYYLRNGVAYLDNGASGVTT